MKMESQSITIRILANEREELGRATMGKTH